MESALPYVGMVVTQFAQVGLLIASKEALLSGMSTFTFAFYSSFTAACLLLLSSFLVYRSNRPPIYCDFLLSCFLIGVLGLLMQIVGLAGTFYASASLSTAMFSLIPGFTFLLAVLFRMEIVEFRSLSTLAKIIGTLVAATGALVSTFYRGPSLLKIPSSPNVVSFHSPNQSSNWVLGGILLGIDCVLGSLFVIAQALVLKKYQVELIIMFFYSCIVAVLSAAASLIMDRDVNTWSLNSKPRLLAIMYSGLFGHVPQATIIAWCVKKKGPLFAATFQPVAIVTATVTGVIFLHERFYLGSLFGSIIIVIGFYSVMWGKAEERKMVDNIDKNVASSSMESGNKEAPLLGFQGGQKRR